MSVLKMKDFSEAAICNQALSYILDYKEEEQI